MPVSYLFGKWSVSAFLIENRALTEVKKKKSNFTFGFCNARPLFTLHLAQAGLEPANSLSEKCWSLRFIPNNR